MAALASEREARAVAEYAATRAQAELSANRQPRQPSVDPLDRYAQEGIALPAAEQKDLLGAAIDQRAQAYAARAAAEADRRAAIRESKLVSDLALQSVMQSNPDLADPKNQAKFAGAMVEAEYEARSMGRTLNPMQLAQEAAKKFRSAQPAPQPPYVEGAGNPAMPAGSQEPEGPNPIEELYELEPGTVKQARGKQFIPDEYTKDFVKENNARMFDRGVLSNMAGVISTLK